MASPYCSCDVCAKNGHRPHEAVTDPEPVPSPALAALAMRERAAGACDGFCGECARAIRALPTTFTDAELLAAAMQLPEVRALVEAAERAKASIENGGGGGVIDVVWLDGPTNETVCDYLAAALAPFRK